MDKAHHPEINVGAANILRTALSSRWADEPTDYYNAGFLLETELHDLPKPPRFQDPNNFTDSDLVIHDEWANAPFKVDLTESERDTIKKCLTGVLKSKSLPVGKYTNTLIKAFGLLK